MTKRTWFTGAAIAAAGIAFIVWSRRGADGPVAKSDKDSQRAARKVRSAGTGTVVEQPGSVAGSVRGKDGAAIAGATVQLIASDARAAEGAATLTTEDGDFAFADVAPGDYRITAAKAGYRPSEPRILDVHAASESSATLVLEPGGNAARGQVSDVSGGPIAGASVQFIPMHGPLASRADESIAAITDERGEFELGLGNGRYQAVAFHSEYVATKKVVELRDGDRTVDFTLSPGGVIEGTVSSVDSGQPVAGAIVRYGQSPRGGLMGEGGSSGAVVSDASGRYRITGLPAGAINLSAVSPRGATREPSQVGLGLGETLTDIDLLVEGGHRVAGKLVDTRNKQPLPSTTVVITRGRQQLAETITDDGGQFSFENIAEGAARIEARGEGILPNLFEDGITIPAGGVDDLVVEVKRGYFVTGRVEPTAIADVMLDLSQIRPGAGVGLNFRTETRTASDGTFKLGPLAPGEIPLIAQDAEGRVGRKSVAIVESDVAGVVFELESGATVSGRVLDDEGKPVPGARVTARPKSSSSATVIINGVNVSTASSPTHEDGSYAISGLDPGDYTIAVAGTAAHELGRAPHSKGSKGITLAPRQSLSGVDLEVEARDGVIRGVAKLASGGPAADVWIRAAPSAPTEGRMPHAGPPHGRGDDRETRTEARTMMVIADSDDGGSIGSSPAVALTDADGRFEIRNLENGRYDITGEGMRGAARGFSLGVETDSETTVTLFSLSKIEGKVTAAGQPVKNYFLELVGRPSDFPRHKRVQSEDGRFSLARVDPGKYVLRVRSDGADGEAELEVQAGRTTITNVELESLVAVRGRLLDEGGKPIEGALMLANPQRDDGRMEVSIMIDDSHGGPPRSRSDGRFQVQVKPGKYVLLALDMEKGKPVLMKPIEVGTDNQNLGDVVSGGVP